MPQLYDPDRGWRMQRSTGSIQWGESMVDGPSRLAVPLVVIRDGAVRGEGNLWLASPEARQLFLGLARMVNGVVATPADYAHLFGERTDTRP